MTTTVGRVQIGTGRVRPVRCARDASLWEEEEAAGGLDQRHGLGHRQDEGAEVVDGEKEGAPRAQDE